MKAADGTALSPGYQFSDQSGLYLALSGTPAISINGTLGADWFKFFGSQNTYQVVDTTGVNFIDVIVNNPSAGGAQLYNHANSSVLLGSGGDMYLMTSGATSGIHFGTGGTSNTKERMKLNADGSMEMIGLASAPTVGAANDGAMYYDRTLQKYQCSINGAAYDDCAAGFGLPTPTPQPTPTLVPTATPQPTPTPFGGDRMVFSGSTGIGTLGATMLASMYKPTVGITLTRISGIVLAAGTCTACGVTDTTFRVTDGSTNSDCLNASAITCTSAAGTTFFCTPSNANRAADQQLSLETVSVGGTCTVAPIMGINAEYGLQ
jgi:hypothetical protein